MNVLYFFQCLKLLDKHIIYNIWYRINVVATLWSLTQHAYSVIMISHIINVCTCGYCAGIDDKISDVF